MEDLGRNDHFAQGHTEARAWAAGHRDFRVKSRLKDYQSWFGSANGDHRTHVQEQALGYIAGLQEHLGRSGSQDGYAKAR